MIAAKFVIPYMPRLEIVNVPPYNGQITTVLCVCYENITFSFYIKYTHPLSCLLCQNIMQSLVQLRPWLHVK